MPEWESVEIQVRESGDVPAGCVAVLEIRCLNPDLYEDAEPVTTIHLTPGYPVEELVGWLRMRFETLRDTGLAPDQFDMSMDGEEVVARAYVRMHPHAGPWSSSTP